MRRQHTLEAPALPGEPQRARGCLTQGIAALNAALRAGTAAAAAPRSPSCTTRGAATPGCATAATSWLRASSNSAIWWPGSRCRSPMMAQAKLEASLQHRAEEGEAWRVLQEGGRRGASGWRPAAVAAAGGQWPARAAPIPACGGQLCTCPGSLAAPQSPALLPLLPGRVSQLRPSCGVGCWLWEPHERSGGCVSQCGEHSWPPLPVLQACGAPGAQGPCSSAALWPPLP